MKKLAILALASLMMFTIAGCGSKTSDTADASANTSVEESASAPAGEEAADNTSTVAESVAESAEGDIAPTDVSAYAGTYQSEDEETTLTIKEDGSVNIDITRLTSIDGKATGIYKGIIPITGKDAADGDIGFEFNTETGELIVVDSTWEYLPNGESFNLTLQK